jgi:hypothetical protein
MITKKRLVISGLIVLFLSYFVVPSTITLVRLRWRIASALKQARVVRLEEFQGYRQPQVLSSVDLTGKDASAVLAALPYAPDVGCPGVKTFCSFRPHHRIVVVTQDGTTMNIELCFMCAALSLKQPAINRAPIIEMPFAWRPPLRRLFTNHGIAERKRYNDFDPFNKL